MTQARAPLPSHVGASTRVPRLPRKRFVAVLCAGEVLPVCSTRKNASGKAEHPV